MTIPSERAETDEQPPTRTSVYDELARMGFHVRPADGTAADAEAPGQPPSTAAPVTAPPVAAPLVTAPPVAAPPVAAAPGAAPGMATPPRAGEPLPAAAPAPAPAYDPGTAFLDSATTVAPEGPRPTSESLTADSVLRRRRVAPAHGWRRALYSATGGAVNVGPSPAELRERELIARARTPISGCHRLAVISLKGGVGKTTTSVTLGSMFAVQRGDRVIAVDANPDRGTLGEKVPRETRATVRDLLNARQDVRRYADVRAFTSQAPSRLEVLASDADPGVSLAFSEADYRATIDILEHFYSLIVTDCGTGLLHSAMKGVLELADTLIIVSSPSLDGARSASATLDWLEAHGYGELVRRSVAVISTVRPTGGSVDVDKLEEHFAARCRAVERIPYDTHLEAGAVVNLDELRAATRDAYLRLAATVADGFTARR